MRIRKIPPAILAACCAGMLAGCMVPPHRLPHGFSSSYHRNLYGMEPVIVGGVPNDAIPLNHSPGVFFPSRVHIDAPPSAAVAAPSDRAAEKPAPIYIPPAQTAKKSAAKSR